GKWDADESKLREQGINRLGNIYVESDAYVKLEEYLNNDFFPVLFEDEKLRTPTEVAKALGEDCEDKDSFLNHAARHDIPVFCPALIDAEIGDFLFY
ncbi:MAG: deoxyhypusine synthase family protein, partial [Candidatus Aenigmatarchaeota archaeon]